MSRSLGVRRRARGQINRAVKWYDRQRPGLGDELKDEVRRTFAAVKRRPEMFPVVVRTARRALLDRFPYGVYFLLAGRAIVVIGFVHHRQDRDAALAGLV